MDSFAKEGLTKAFIPTVLLIAVVEALKTLYVIESGRGDIHIFECIENDSRPVFFGVYCFEHWVQKSLNPANDN